MGRPKAPWADGKLCEAPTGRRNGPKALQAAGKLGDEL